MDALAPDSPSIGDAVAGSLAGVDLASPLDAGGFCVHVLRAALHFTGRATSFDAALRPALAFSGPDNYCPVLVGALAGARFGAPEITPEHIAHCRPGVIERCARVADDSEPMWCGEAS
mmetsp:Transcript_36306/g.84816  ORF Transcript_36306/g.84816 Transcript_36306/m.84816 type:complete len:118 (-) Transcript_36306:193-546(-)